MACKRKTQLLLCEGGSYFLVKNLCVCVSLRNESRNVIHINQHSRLSSVVFKIIFNKIKLFNKIFNLNIFCTPHIAHCSHTHSTFYFLPLLFSFKSVTLRSLKTISPRTWSPWHAKFNRGFCTAS